MIRTLRLPAFFCFLCQGKHLYTLAQKRCGNFGTCGGADGITGTAAINDAILELIMAGSDYLLRGKCTEAEDAKEKIVNLMTVPLVQGVLRYVDSMQNSLNSLVPVGYSEDYREREVAPDRLL